MLPSLEVRKTSCLQNRAMKLGLNKKHLSTHPVFRMQSDTATDGDVFAWGELDCSHELHKASLVFLKGHPGNWWVLRGNLPAAP